MLRIKQWVKRNFSGLIYHRQKRIARKYELLRWLDQFEKGPATTLSDASFDIFTYHGEDGIISYLFQRIDNVPHMFVDIGAGDCVKSNCTSLITHFGWSGVFIDRDERQLAIGKSFYKNQLNKGVKINFICAEVTDRNVNELISGCGIKDEIGLLSIDIDGNDYWIWKAITILNPKIVVIEAKVEFGFRNVIVPYGPDNHHSADKMYNGASVESLRLLGEKKGYKLVGSNKQGYNLFFVRQNENIPSATNEEVLKEPETLKSFYPDSFFNEQEFISE